MFVALEYPAADIRRFLPGGPWVLDRPDWPDPVTRQDDSTGYDHLRGFGAVEKRRRGGLGTWSGEHAFALAHNALRFPSSLGSAAAAGSNQALRGARVAARRFFNDGTAVARLELGLALRDGDPIDAIRDAATLGVRVPALSGPRLAEFEMRLAHGPIFRNYLRLTTRRGEYEPWWCTPGQPLALVELSADRFDAVAGLTIPTGIGMRVGYRTIEMPDSTQLPAWFIGFEPGHDRDALRRLRLNLVRIHAEWEAISGVVSLVDRDRLPTDPADRGTVRLATYLKQASRFLAGEQRYGFSQAPIQQAAQRVVSGIFEDRLAAVNGRFDAVLARVESETSTAGEKIRSAKLHIERLLIMDNSKNQEVNVSGTIHGDVNVTAADIIQGSFNKVPQAPTEIQQDLTDLHEQVKEILPQLDEKQRKDVLRSLETLTEEATKEEPDERWYSVSAEGLLEAAKNIGAAADPIITTVGKILTFLA